MHQDHIRFAAPAEGQSSAGAHADGLHLIPGLLLEQRQQDLEQAAVLGAGSRRQDELAS